MTEEFPKLVAAAQVGTRKAPPERATDLPLEGTERAVLIELGTLALMRRAGTTAVAATPVPAAPPESLRIADVADALDEALDDSMPAALEWAREAAARGFVAPTAVVSRLVPLAAKQRELRPVLGERGRWLAGVMGIDPTEAKEELPSKDDWDALRPKERLRLIEGSPEDAALLSKALGDRRKDVREAAAERLLSLPASPQAQALRLVAQATLTLRRTLLGRTLDVERPDPDSLPDWLPRTGMKQGMGPAAVALFDLVRHVPPETWGFPAKELLPLAAKTDDAEALVDGWGEAALRFGAQEWIDALLSHVHRLPGRSGLFAQRASEAAFDAEIEARFRSAERIEGAYGLLVQRKGPFSASLSRRIVQSAQAGLGSLYLMPDLGPNLDLSVLPLVDAPWEDDHPYEAVRLRWRKLLDLRRRLLKSLE